MSQLNMILQSELCANLLSALLHSLWQGLIIAGILFLYLRSKSGHDADRRYTSSLVALFSTLFCLIFTWSFLNYEPVSASNDTIAKSAEQMITTTAKPAGNSIPINHKEITKTATSFNWTPPVIGLWLTGVVIMLLRAIYIIAGGANIQLQ